MRSTGIAALLTLALAMSVCGEVQAVTTAMSGGPDGTRYDLACGAGQAMVGIAGNAGSWINRVGPICMPVNANGTWRQPRTDGASSFTGGSGGQSFEIVCPRDQSVTGIRGVAGSYVDQLRIQCRDLSDPVRTRGTRTFLPASAGNAGLFSGTFGPSVCPDDRAATGLFGRSGSYVDSIGLKCMDETEWRPVFHFAPDRGWMNDPAGLVQVAGRYQLYYQAVPRANTFDAEALVWGHADSADLVSWAMLEPTLARSTQHLGPLTWILAPFTGSGVITRAADPECGCGSDASECVVSLYTRSRTLPPFHQNQWLARSCDGGVTFTDPGTMVLDTGEGQPHFRDPKVFWYQHPTNTEQRYWVMVVASGSLVRLYRSGTADQPSTDLTQWTHLSDVRVYPPADLNQHYRGPFVETPDLVELPVENRLNTSTWMLLFAEGYLPPSVPVIGVEQQSKSWYVSGDFDGTLFRAAVSSFADAPSHVSAIARRLDAGPDFYAPQTWFVPPPRPSRLQLRRRPTLTETSQTVIAPIRLPPRTTSNPTRVLAGWQNNWRYAHQLPTGRWKGQLAIPRELSAFRAEDGSNRLRQVPARQLTSHRRSPRPIDWRLRDVDFQGTRTVRNFASRAFDAELTIQPTSAVSEVRVNIRSGTRVGQAAVRWRRTEESQGELILDRSNGYAGGGSPPDEFTQLIRTPLDLEDGSIEVRILVDRSSIEVFANGGKAVLSGLFFPHPDNTAFSVTTSGGSSRIVSLDLYDLGR